MPFDPDRSRSDKKPGQWRAFRPSSRSDDASWREAFGDQDSPRETLRTREVEVEAPEPSFDSIAIHNERFEADPREGASDVYDDAAASPVAADEPSTEVLWPETYRLTTPPGAESDSALGESAEPSPPPAPPAEPPLPLEYSTRDEPPVQETVARTIAKKWIWSGAFLIVLLVAAASNRGTAYGSDYYKGVIGPVETRFDNWTLGVPIVHGRQGDEVVVDYRFHTNENGAIYVWLYNVIPDKGLLNGDSFGETIRTGGEGSIRIRLPKDGFYWFNHTGTFADVNQSVRYDVTYRIWWRVE